MKKRETAIARMLLALSFVLVFSGASLAQSNSDTSTLRPPMTEKKTKTTKINNDTMVDDYFWLREKANPEVIAHLEAENAYAEAAMKPTAALQDKLYKEMVGHIKETDDSVPYQWGTFFYYTRTEQGKQYPIYCRKKGSVSAPEEVVLDQNELAKGLKFFNIGAFVPSDDGNLLAYSTDSTGYRQYKLQIKDLRTGQLMPETFERVGNVAWATDNKTIFFTTEDAVTKRSDKFFRHALGSDQTDLVFEEKDELFDIGTGRSRDKAVIFLGSESKTSTEWQYIPADSPTAGLKIISPREADHEYNVDHRGDLFYIRTNKGAKNFRVVTAPVADPAQANWKELIAHRPEVKVEDIDLFADYLVLSEWEKGLQNIEVLDFSSHKRQLVEFPEPVYSAFIAQNHEFASHVLRYNYQSLVTPNSVFDYNMTTRKAALLKETEVPGGFSKDNYKSERLFANATDGTKIPLSVVYRKGTKLDGSAALLLYGYGSYGASIPPTFSSNRLALLDRGVIYVIAHIRGGGELGEEWREAGAHDEEDEYLH